MLTRLETMRVIFARQAAIEKKAEALLCQYDLYAQGWRFAWNKRKRAFGLCDYRAKTIELSTPLFALTTDESAADTLLHELAHAIAPRGAGHGPQWRAACRLVGANPERCKLASQAMSVENVAIHVASFKYTMTCPRCAYSCGQSRAPKTGVCCGVCHRKTREMIRFAITQNR